MQGDVFNADRPRLFSIAYRMLGSASDAEDVLQDAWLRYSGADESAIRSPRAFATTVVTRLCLDRLKSARTTREEYIGTWLPEPALTAEVDAPDVVALRAESVTLAFLVLLDTLSPEERAAFLLKDVFGYGHAEIADILRTTPENSRQLLHRAKARLAKQRPQFTRPAPERRAVAERFVRAFAAGDASALTSLLAADVGLWSDGGGKASASRHPLLGRERVLNFLVGLHRTAHNTGAIADVSVQIEDVNSEPALIVLTAGRLASIFVLSVEGDAIAGIRVVRNPDKLVRIDRQLASRR
jgi:RNA polymerase sigma-70 factor (ECF subfamily)